MDMLVTFAVAVLAAVMVSIVGGGILLALQRRGYDPSSAIARTLSPVDSREIV